MNMSERLAEMTSEVRDQAGELAAKAADAARGTVDRAAHSVAAAKAPITTLAHAGLKLNKLAHDYVQQVVSHQARMLTGVVTDSAERLRRLAKADSIQGAYADQVEYFDVTRERVSRDAKQALEIVVGAGRQVTDLATQTYAEFVRAPKSKAKAKARTQRARATARKSGKASVKARARKAA